MLSSSSNKTISSNRPSIYLRDAERKVGNKVKDWLKSNLISSEAYEAALRDDFESFVEIRAKTLHEAIIQKAGWPVDNEPIEQDLDVMDLEMNDSDTTS
jgi:hypothetical protein